MRPTTAADWYLAHGLAFVTMGALIAMLCVQIWVDFPDPGSHAQIPAIVVVPVFLGVIAIFWFWIKMLVDFFRHPPPAHPVAWGLMLFFASYGTALVYFFVIWRPRHRPQAN